MAKVATNPVLRGVFSKEPKMIADVEYDGDVEDDEETPLVMVVRRRTRRRRRRVRMGRVGCSIQ